MEAYYNRQNIKPVATGPGTPWPNRAEAAVRLLKHQIKLILQILKDGDPQYNGITMKYGNLVRQACLARNSSITYGGVTPLEMAFGRRPRDVITPENADPNQLTGNPTDTEVTARAIKELANRAYQEARQSDDLRRDLAARLSMTEGPFSLGDKVFYWSEDKSKIGSTGSKHGSWLKGKVISELGGSMVGVDLGTRIVRVNISKLRKNYDITSDVEIPLAPDEETLTSEGSDHASCMVTFDASLQSTDLTIPHQECHWQVTSTGKIDFLELYGGSPRMSHKVSWNKVHPSTFSGVLFQMTGGKTSPSVRTPPDVIMSDEEVSPSDPSEPMSTNRSRITSDDVSMPEPDQPMPPGTPPSRPPPPIPPPRLPAVSSDEPVAPARAKPRVHPPPRVPSPRHIHRDPFFRYNKMKKTLKKNWSQTTPDNRPYYSDEEGDLVVDEKDWVLLTEEQFRSDIREEYDLLTEEEATAKEKREMKKQFDEAKAAEYQSWLDNDVFELVDTRFPLSDSTRQYRRTMSDIHTWIALTPSLVGKHHVDTPNTVDTDFTNVRKITLYEGVLQGPWDNSPLLYWDNNVGNHARDPRQFCTMLAHHLQTGLPQEVKQCVSLDASGEYDYSSSVPRLTEVTGLSPEMCFHILSKTNRVGRWLAHSTRHLQNQRQDLFAGQHNYLLDMSKLADAELAQYTPQEIALGVLLNTKSRFVVTMVYNQDGKAETTDAAVTIPQDANVLTMTKLFLSAVGGHGSRRTLPRAEEPDPEEERPRSHMTISDFMATGSNPVQSHAQRLSTNAPRPVGMEDFVRQNNPCYIMHATDLQALSSILRHGLVPSNLLSQVVTSPGLQALVNENSRSNRDTVQFSTLNLANPNPTLLRANKALLLVFDANNVVNEVTNMWQSQAGMFATPEVVHARTLSAVFAPSETLWVSSQYDELKSIGPWWADHCSEQMPSATYESKKWCSNYGQEIESTLRKMSRRNLPPEPPKARSSHKKSFSLPNTEADTAPNLEQTASAGEVPPKTETTAKEIHPRSKLARQAEADKDPDSLMGQLWNSDGTRSATEVLKITTGHKPPEPVQDTSANVVPPKEESSGTETEPEEPDPNQDCDEESDAESASSEKSEKSEKSSKSSSSSELRVDVNPSHKTNSAPAASEEKKESPTEEITEKLEKVKLDQPRMTRDEFMQIIGYDPLKGKNPDKDGPTDGSYLSPEACLTLSNLDPSPILCEWNGHVEGDEPPEEDFESYAEIFSQEASNDLDEMWCTKGPYKVITIAIVHFNSFMTHKEEQRRELVNAFLNEHSQVRHLCLNNSDQHRLARADRLPADPAKKVAITDMEDSGSGHSLNVPASLKVLLQEGTRGRILQPEKKKEGIASTVCSERQGTQNSCYSSGVVGLDFSVFSIAWNVFLLLMGLHWMWKQITRRKEQYLLILQDQKVLPEEEVKIGAFNERQLEKPTTVDSAPMQTLHLTKPIKEMKVKDHGRPQTATPASSQAAPKAEPKATTSNHGYDTADAAFTRAENRLLGIFSSSEEDHSDPDEPHPNVYARAYDPNLDPLKDIPTLLLEDMTLDPEVRAVGGWRGPIAVARQSPEYEAAMEVVAAAMDLAQEESTREDVLDRYWLLNGAALEKLLGKGESQQADKICLLAKACSRQCSSYPSLVRVRAPAKVFGDIHGQLRDLLLLFGLFGKPYHCGGDIQTMSYVFNGDWVDRGEHQLEVVTLLFALHVLYPQQVYLVRGNHEFRDMSENMGELGFLHHCQQRMKKRWRLVFEAIHSAFDWLPIGALVGDKALVIHGGLGDGSWGLHDLEHVKRPMQTLMDDNALNALWSDPSDSDHCMARGVHANEERGEGAGIHQFGPDVTQAFCRREGINLVIRSHQFVRQGFKVMHGGHLITLFSARNYLWEDGEASENDAAMLLLATDLNGHLRVHPKRIAFMPNPGPPKPSWWEKTMSDISACWHFMATGQRLNKKRRVSVRGSAGAANAAQLMIVDATPYSGGEDAESDKPSARTVASAF
ncbi:BSL3 [Symbiodinium sp. CCMP2592]|nr:BSL3 [Symbiodinium sp. CCMP2592]